MIWKHNPSPEMINAMSKDTLASHLGIEIIEIGTDYIRSKMPVDYRTRQPYGMLHGGASVVLSETVGSLATALLLEDFTRWSVLGIEVSASHVKSAREGFVYGVTRPVKLGKTLQIWQTDVSDESGNLVCNSKLTTMVIPVKDGK